MLRIALNKRTAYRLRNKEETFDMEFNGVRYGRLSHDITTGIFSMRLRHDTPLAIRPSIIYGSVVLKETLKPVDYIPTSSEIYAWICDRSIPSNRQNIDSILYNNNISHYEPWELMKQNNGRSITDGWAIISRLIPKQKIKIKK